MTRNLFHAAKAAKARNACGSGFRKAVAGRLSRQCAALAASVVLAFGSTGLSTSAVASGVPVVDLAAITQMLEQKKARIEFLDKEIERCEERNSELDDELVTLSGELKSVIEDLISEVDRNTDTAMK